MKCRFCDIDHCHSHIIPMNSRDDVATKRVHNDTRIEATN